MNVLAWSVCVLRECVPRVGTVKTIHNIKKPTHRFFSRTGFIIYFLEESRRGIYCLVPLCEGFWLLLVQVPSQFNMSLNQGSCMLLRYLRLLRATKKSTLPWARLVIKKKEWEKNINKKENKKPRPPPQKTKEIWNQRDKCPKFFA